MQRTTQERKITLRSENNKTIESPVKHWYLPLLMGIVLIMLGIWIWMNPASSFIALAFLFGLTLLGTGIIEIVSAILERARLRGWVWKLTVGIINLLLGVFVTARPDITFVVLPVYVAFAVMLRAFSSIGWSLELREYGVSDWWAFLLTGVIGSLLALVLGLGPAFSSLPPVYFMAAAFILVGVFQIYLALVLRKLRKRTIE